MLYFFRPFSSLIYKSGVLSILGRLIRSILLKIGPGKYPLCGLCLEVLTETAQTSGGEDYGDDSGDADHVDIGLSSIENILSASHNKGKEESELRQLDLVPSHNNMFLLGPGETYAHSFQKGDLFCMVVGATDPFILRRQLNGFELIGTAKDNTFHPIIWRNCVKWREEGSLELMGFMLQ
ncbi:hypothetical protein BGZ60DRAFT_524778 [Tricladium varicosporioides]|nr:hypothetical protein BGZ60DRAFT_524778 [Hymenoscyphus varicosporioides]